ncbi:MAG: hypothetical protein HC822_12210 [Oscillochloris sp.]|nr:hypothetical protein [Oscillochloris sp.]
MSYWDPNYFGREWAIFEHLLIAGLLIFLLRDWLHTRRLRQHRADLQ